MRGVALAAAAAVAIGVSLATPAQADTVIFSGVGTLNTGLPPLFSLPGAGTYDITLSSSRLAGFSTSTGYDTHVDIYKAPPAFPHDSNLLTGSNSFGSLFQDFPNTTGFSFAFVVPPDLNGTIIADDYYVAYGATLGQTLYTTVRYENPFVRLDVSPNSGDPLEYTFTITRRNAAVPEPATWALMILGFGMAGGAVRSRRRDLPQAA